MDSEFEHPPLSQASHDAIQLWRTQTHPGQERAAIIASLYETVLDGLKLVLRETQSQDSGIKSPRSLEDTISTLFFWGQDFEVSEGVLDSTLQCSHRLRDTILVILISSAEILQQRLSFMASHSTQRKTSSTIPRIATLIEKARQIVTEPLETTKFEGNEASDFNVTMQNKIGSLCILSTSLETPARDDLGEEEDVRAWTELYDRPPHEYYSEMIRSRFLLADDHIVKRIGILNWARYNHIKDLRARSIQPDSDQDHVEEISIFHDSGIGSSSATKAGYAATIMSSRAEAVQARMPPLPLAAKAGQTFQCEICIRKLEIRNTKEWRQETINY
ncbi:hypothetical protein DM02DRAFT_659337 [Periconia macrospinosa]|uniref:Uncharacterized protein n=1 Tax=Periconia macrospinosa TaxID=97972 RepID=A0A2V1DE25_9PLEO|nr:hypothetical protein DM02DRAFT_659337 [Periconia macrospinosa]